MDFVDRDDNSGLFVVNVGDKPPIADRLVRCECPRQTSDHKSNKSLSQELSTDVVDPELFISSSEIVRQPRDHSCFYHSVAYCINECISSLPSNALMLKSSIERVTGVFDAFSLRSFINDYVTTHGSTLVNLGYSVTVTIIEAISLVSGLSFETYVANQSINTSWGGILEAATAVLLFPVNIYIFERVIGSTLLKATCYFESILVGSVGNDIFLLYSGYNHYDSILRPVYVNSSGFFTELRFACSNIYSSIKRRQSFVSIIETRQTLNTRTDQIAASKALLNLSSMPTPKRCILRRCYRRRSIIATKRFVKSMLSAERISNGCSSEGYRGRALNSTKKFLEYYSRCFQGSFHSRAIIAARRQLP